MGSERKQGSGELNQAGGYSFTKGEKGREESRNAERHQMVAKEMLRK